MSADNRENIAREESIRTIESRIRDEHGNMNRDDLKAYFAAGGDVNAYIYGVSVFLHKFLECIPSFGLTSILVGGLSCFVMFYFAFVPSILVARFHPSFSRSTLSPLPYTEQDSPHVGCSAQPT